MEPSNRVFGGGTASVQSHGLSSANPSREQKCQVRGQLPLYRRNGDTGECLQALPGEGQASHSSQVSLNCPYESSSQKVLHVHKGAF